MKRLLEYRSGEVEVLRRRLVVPVVFVSSTSLGMLAKRRGLRYKRKRFFMNRELGLGVGRRRTTMTTMRAVRRLMTLRKRRRSITNSDANPSESSASEIRRQLNCKTLLEAQEGIDPKSGYQVRECFADTLARIS